MKSLLSVAALLVVAGVATVSAQTLPAAKPLTLSTTLSNQWLNATNGNFYTFSVASSQVVTFYSYNFAVNLLQWAAGQTVAVRAYWQVGSSFSEMTPSGYYLLTSDAVATAGYLSLAIDPKALFDKYQGEQPPPSSIQIGFLVTTTATVPLVRHGVFSATLTASASNVANDANGDVPSGGVPGRAFTGNCPGTSTRCQLVANMREHNHQYLEAAVTVTSGTFYSATMRNAAFFSYDDTKYFASAEGTGTVYPRTCALTNSSCAIEQAYYYVELRTTASAGPTNGYSATWTMKAAAPAAAQASLVTAAAVAALAYLTSRL